MLQDSLDILVEVLGRFGHYVSGQHELLLQTLLPHLDDNRAGVRKRALQAVGERGRGVGVWWSFWGWVRCCCFCWRRLVVRVTRHPVHWCM